MAARTGTSTFQSFGREVDQHLSDVEAKARKVIGATIASINDRWVPQARRHSSLALRAASAHLARLAAYLERGAA